MASNGNPLVQQGFLNRVKGALSITDIPALNVSASYLAREGISLRTMGPATDVIPTMTGTIGSQVPYMQVELVVHLLRTQALGATWQSRFTTDTALGETVLTTDSTVMGDFTIRNVFLTNFQEMPVNGSDAGFILTLSGYWVTNNNMWS